LIDAAYTTQDPNALKASYTTMAFVSDGCSEYLKKSYLKQFVTAIKMGLNSSNETVKSAAMYALGEVSQYVQVGIFKFLYDQVNINYFLIILFSLKLVRMQQKYFQN